MKVKIHIKQHKLLISILFFLFYTISCTAQQSEIVWQNCFGGSNWDKVKDIAPTVGGFFLGGSTMSADGDVSFNHGLNDYWLIKIDSSGNFIWERTYGGSLGEGIKRIVSTTGYYYYLVGSSLSVDGDISYNPYPSGSSNIWVVKIDSSGQIIWEKMFGGTGIDEVYNAIATPDGGLIIKSITSSNDGDVSVYYGFWDLWFVKLSPDGDIEWDFTLGSSGPDYAGTIKHTSDGGYIVAGSTTGAEGFGNYDTACNYHGTPGGFTDVWIIKLDAMRNIQWQQCYGGFYHDGAFDIVEVSDGYVFAGDTQSNDGDVSGYHGVPGNNDYGADFWVVKIDFDGNLLWQQCLGGYKNDWATNIHITDDGGFNIIGQTHSNDGDVSGNHSVSSAVSDVWVVKTDSNGIFEWQQCFGGANKQTVYPDAVVYGNSYNYTIASTSWSSISGNIDCDSQGYSDYWVFEVDITTSITEAESNTEIKVYPNPAGSYVVFECQNISYHSNGKRGIIQITDLLGQKLAKMEVIAEKTVWDCNNIKPGIYLYTLTVNGVKKSGKIVITK